MTDRYGWLAAFVVVGAGVLGGVAFSHLYNYPFFISTGAMLGFWLAFVAFDSILDDGWYLVEWLEVGDD